jgi:hypothetical protein
MAARVRSGRFRGLARRVLVPAATLAIAGGGAIFSSSPASAATSTDTIYVVNGSTTQLISLPAGTPDVVSPLDTAVTSTCFPVVASLLNAAVPFSVIQSLQQAQIDICYVSPAHSEGINVVNVGNAGLFEANGFPPNPPCGLFVYENFNTGIFLARPGC